MLRCAVPTMDAPMKVMPRTGSARAADFHNLAFKPIVLIVCLPAIPNTCEKIAFERYPTKLKNHARDVDKRPQDDSVTS